jgi:Ca-activated chloride channel family protein
VNFLASLRGTLERPWVLLFLLTIPLLVAEALLRLRTGRALTSSRYFTARSAAASACLITGWFFLIIAWSGLFWGQTLVPGLRHGNALSLVFDISWSMTANDCPGNETRQATAQRSALSLLTRLEGVPVSVVMAKGAGVLALPLTDDHAEVASLVTALSPAMMSAVGSSIGGGVDAALRSFPPTLGFAPTIVVFTDGDETDGALASALVRAREQGIPVMFVGFGSPRETEILLADGVTPVKTALRADKLRSLGGDAAFFDGNTPASLNALLAALQERSQSTLVYETQRVDRWRFFLFIALACFVASVLVSEWGGIPRAGEKIPLFILAGALLFQSCGRGNEGQPTRSGSGKQSLMLRVLQGSYHWRWGEYDKAVTDYFLVLDEDGSLRPYALNGLAARYVMQGEPDAALERLAEIGDDAPDAVRFSAAFNRGLLLYDQAHYGDAAGAFRQALEINGSDPDAKINLELALAQHSANANEAAGTLVPASINDTAIEEQQAAQNALFSLVREQEQNRWKSSTLDSSGGGGLDY